MQIIYVIITVVATLILLGSIVFAFFTISDGVMPIPVYWRVYWRDPEFSFERSYFGELSKEKAINHLMKEHYRQLNLMLRSNQNYMLNCSWHKGSYECVKQCQNLLNEIKTRKSERKASYILASVVK